MDRENTNTLTDSISYDTSNSQGALSNTTQSSSKSIGIQQREEDYTRDNDLDRLIQSERINKILNEAVYKIKLVISLPLLGGKCNGMLVTQLSDKDLDYVTFICKLCENLDFTSSLQESVVMEHFKDVEKSAKNRTNPELARLICILNSYPSLRPEVEKLVEKIKQSYVSYQTDPANPAVEFLLCVEQFRDLMLRQTQSTAASLWAEKVKYKEMEILNSVLIKKIQEYKKTIEEENENFNNAMKIKTKVLADLERDMEIHKTNSVFCQQTKVHYSDCLMVVMAQDHAVNMKLLNEDNTYIREKFESILQTNMLVEKKKRAQKYKCEVQLLSWMSKYDKDMAEKQVELEDFEEKWEEENKKIVILEEKQVELDKKYLPLMEEKEEEYRLEMTEKMNQFMRDHAARVLQYAWKSVLANRVEKKKLKKQIFKMQKEEDKRQRMAVVATNRAIAAAKTAAKAEKKRNRK